MIDFLNQFVLLMTAIFFALVVVTLLLWRRDKHFALSLAFTEMAMYVAICTFGQGLLFRVLVNFGSVQAEFDTSGSSPPPYFSAIVVIVFCGLFALAMMALRTFDGQAAEILAKQRANENEKNRGD